jgi:hypothetical protein
MISPSFLRALALTLILPGAAACGSVVDAQHAAGSTGSGGASTTTTIPGSGGATPFCGGKAGIPCGPTQYCHYDPSTPCGNADGTGTCEPRPDGCLDDCPGVCGCDGKFYCYACDAYLSGIDVGTGTACLSPDAYEAVSLFTNVPRFAILKASPTRNLCFRVFVVLGSGTGLPGITGSGVIVESAVVTHDAADCQLPAGPPPMPAGATHPVVSGMGSVSMVQSTAGCTTTIHAKLVLSGQPPWAPPSEMLDADALPILGGCP